MTNLINKLFGSDSDKKHSRKLKVKFQKAENHYYAKRYTSALKIINDILEEKPKFIKAVGLKIRILIKKREFKQAEDLIEKYSLKNKNNPIFLNSKARIEFLKNNIETAKSLFFKVLKKDKKNYGALKGLSDLYQKENDIERSIEYLEKATKIESHNDDWLKLAKKYKKVHANEEAIKALKNIKYYSKINEFTPYKKAEKEFELGKLFEEKNDYKNARNHYELSAKLNPKYSETYNRLGFIYSKLAEFQKAIEYYKKAARRGHRECQQMLRKKKIEWR